MNTRIKGIFEANKEVFTNEEIEEIFKKGAEYENLLTMVVKPDGTVIKKEASKNLRYHYQALDECNEINDGYRATENNIDRFSRMAAKAGNIVLRNYNGDYLACDLFLPEKLTKKQHAVLKAEEFFLEKNGINLQIHGENTNYKELIEVYEERGMGFKVDNYYDKSLNFQDPNMVEERIIYFGDEGKSL